MPPTNTDSSQAEAHKPPPHLFRVIKQLSKNTFLCLLRTRSSSVEDTDNAFCSYAILPDTVSSSLAPFTRLPYDSFQRQTVLLENSLADALVQNVRHVGASKLSERHIGLLGSLIIVKTCPEAPHAVLSLRNEMDILESLHAHDEHASMHFSPAVVRAQFTSSASNAWVCFSPTFGPSLRSLGEAVSAEQSTQFYLPSWFIGHIFHHLLAALELLSAEGIVHGAIDANTVVVNIYPRYFSWRYRGYPDILLTNFSTARRTQESEDIHTAPTTPTHKDTGTRADTDIKSYLQLIIAVISKWSDSAPFIPKATTNGVIVSDDPVLLLMQTAREMLSAPRPRLADVQRRLGAALERLRSEGPHGVPDTLRRVLHSDLATEEEVRRGVGRTTVLRFGKRRGDVARVVAGERVGIGAGGYVGMRTGRVLVVRFGVRRGDYERLVGSVRMDGEEGMDVDGEGGEVDEMEM
ncbi:hypothetical protein FB567DRAFT_633728 [Paraphoma chrysanthemicola]|uniref:Protein kinase domain-containing protein n=1 Tax=Paraphoma chrysanthemicola TaxID=798071 RepID=A0A8K0QW71_9PLEO|nr:hypothetical protein FB567DRAFT_633728 [Paraphoma chrysanthemicola]